jgi:hypothetical protein
MVSKAYKYASRKAVLTTNLHTLPAISKVAKALHLSWGEVTMLLSNYIYGCKISFAMDEQSRSSECIRIVTAIVMH